tara:strand:+ start:105 stop:1349 length:1245 start_codon:yes stop_codon:yes gene_type:complete
MAIADTFDSDNPYRPYSIPGMDDSYTSLPPIGDDKNWGKKDWLEYVVKKQLEGEYYPFQKGYDFRFEDAITRDYMRYMDYADALEAGDMETANAIASMFEARQFDGELQEPNFTYERNKDGKLEAIPIPGANEDKPLFQDIWDWTTDSIGDAGNWIFDEQGARVDVPWAASRVGDYITDTEWDKVIPNAIAGSPEMLVDLLTTWPQIGYQATKDILGDELSFDDYNIFHNKPKVAFYDEENQGPDSAEALTEELGSGALATYGLYRYLHNKLPTKWASRLANWAPAVHSMSGLGNTTKGKNFLTTFLKNQVGGWGGSLKRAPFTGALLGSPAAFLSTLFYSPPLGAEEEYEGVYATKPKIADTFDFTYNPNANINTALIQDSDPVIFDSYMQEKLDNFEPRTTAPGPRNNYQGL